MQGASPCSAAYSKFPPPVAAWLELKGPSSTVYWRFQRMSILNEIGAFQVAKAQHGLYTVL